MSTYMVIRMAMLRRALRSVIWWIFIISGSNFATVAEMRNDMLRLVDAVIDLQQASDLTASASTASASRSSTAAEYVARFNCSFQASFIGLLQPTGILVGFLPRSGSGGSWLGQLSNWL